MQQESKEVIQLGGGIIQTVITALISTILGALGTIAVFRSKFDVADTKLDAFREQVERDRKADKELVETQMGELRRLVEKSCAQSDEYYKRIERRQTINLELVASMARKAGVAHRALGSDAIARLLNEESEDLSR